MSTENQLYLSDIRIDRLGSIAGQSLDNLSPSLNIVYGPNGSGKSTFKNAILFGLYGLPKNLSTAQSALNNPLTYYSSLSPLREITGTLTEGGERHRFTLSSPNGKASSPSFTEPAGERASELMREDISSEEYSTVWNISNSDLRTIDPGVSNDDTDSRAGSTVFATVVEPPVVGDILNKRIEGQQRSRKTDPEGSLGKTIGLLKTLEARRHALEDDSKQGLGALSELAKLETEKKLLAPLLEQLSSDLINAHNDQTSLEAHEVLRRELTSEKAELEQKIVDPSQAVTQINPNEYEGLIRQGDAIRMAHARESDIETSRAQLRTVQEQIEEKSAEIITYGELPAMSTGADLEGLSENTRDLGQKLRDKREALSHAKQQVEALKIRRADYENEIALPTEPLPKAKLSLMRIVGGSSLILFSIFIILLGLLNIFDSPGSAIAGLFGIVLFALAVFVLAFPAGQLRKPSARSTDDGTELFFMDLTNQERQAETALVLEELAFQDALSAWRGHLKDNLPGVSLETTPESAQTIIAKIRDKSRLAGDLNGLERTAKSLENKISEWEADVAVIYSDLADNVYLPAFGIGAQPLMNALDTALEDRQLYLSLRADLKNLQDNLSATDASLLKLAEKFQEIYARYPSATDYESCMALINMKIKEIQLSQKNLFKESDEITRKITERKGKISEVSNSEELQKTRDEIALAKAHIESIYPAYLIDMLSAKLLEVATEGYLAEHAPNFEEQASAVFHRITKGRYPKIEVFTAKDKKVKGKKIIVTRADLKKFETHELSRGTADQLYIALRIGLLLAYSENGKSLPVVLDDILSTSDADRRVSVMDELLRLAENRQIIFFTFTKSVAEHLADAAREKGIDYRPYELEREEL